MNGLQYLFSISFSFNLRNYIFQSAMKCEMTSFSMTSLHVDLNEATKSVDIMPLTLLASLWRLRTLEKMQNPTIFGLAYVSSLTNL